MSINIVNVVKQVIFGTVQCRGLQGPGRHTTNDFSNRWFFKRAGPARREISFIIAGSGYKKRKTNNIASQSVSTKQRQSF